jgi:hypothetical protein
MVDGVDGMGWEGVRDLLGVGDMDVSLDTKGRFDSGCCARCFYLTAKFDAFRSDCAAIKEGGWGRMVGRAGGAEWVVTWEELKAGMQDAL